MILAITEAQKYIKADAAFINGPDDPEALRVILYNLPMTKELRAILKEKIDVE